MDLSGFGMEQNGVTACTCIINGVRAGDEHGRGADGGPVRRRFNEFEAFALTVAHVLLVHRRKDCHRMASLALIVLASESRVA